MICDERAECIFSAAFGTVSWEYALDKLSEAAGGATFLLASGNLRQPESFKSHTSNFDDSVWKRSGYSEHSQFIPSVNSSIDAVVAAPIGEVFDRRSYCSDEEFRDDPFYQSTMISQDLFYFCVSKVIDEPDFVAGGYMAVPEARGPIEGQLLQQYESWLLPMRMALKTSHELRLNQQVNSSLLAAIGSLHRGVAVIDRNLKILACNALAQDIFSRSSSVTARRGELRLHPHAHHAALMKRIGQIAANDLKGAESFYIPDDHGSRRYKITVIAPDGISQPMDTPTATAVVLIDEPGADTLPPSIETLRNQFPQLTKQEARATRLVLMFPEATKQEIAARMGILLSTVITHLDRARKKLGARNLRHLAQIAGGLR